MLPDPDFWRIIAPLLAESMSEEQKNSRWADKSPTWWEGQREWNRRDRIGEAVAREGGSVPQFWQQYPGMTTPSGTMPQDMWDPKEMGPDDLPTGPDLNFNAITDFLKPLLASLPGEEMPRLPGMDWLDDENLPDTGEPWADVPDWIMPHLPLDTDLEGGSDDIAGYPGTGRGVSWDDTGWAPPGWKELNNIPGTARRETVPYPGPFGTPNPNFTALTDFLKPLLAEENLPGEPVTPYKVPLGLSEESYRDWFNQELARRGGASAPASPWGTYPDENPADVRWRPYRPRDIMETPNPNASALPGRRMEASDLLGPLYPPSGGFYAPDYRNYPVPEDRPWEPEVRGAQDYIPEGTPNPNFTALTDFLKPLLASLPGEEWDWVGERVPDFRGGYDNPRGYPGPVEDWALQWDFDPNAETLEDLAGSVHSRPPFLRDTVDYPGPWGTPNPNFSALEDFLRPLLASNNIWDVERGEDLGLPEAPLSPRTPYDLWDVEQQEDQRSLQDLLPRPVPVRQPGPDVRGPEGVGGTSHAINEPGFFTQLNEYNPVHWLVEALNDQAGVEPEGFNPLTNLGGLWPLLTRFPALVPGV